MCWIRPSAGERVNITAITLTKLELIFHRIEILEEILELAGVEFRSRRRARGRPFDLYSIATDTFNLPRSWLRVTCKTADGRVNGKSEAGPRGFLFPQAARSLACSRGRSSMDMMRYKWYVSTCQHGETADPWPPSNVQLRKAGHIFSARVLLTRAWGDSCPYAIANFACKCPAVRPRTMRITINNDQRANYRPAWIFCAMNGPLPLRFFFSSSLMRMHMTRYVHVYIACPCTTVFHELRTPRLIY